LSQIRPVHPGIDLDKALARYGNDSVTEYSMKTASSQG
jgi:hypothetical protein